MYTGIAQTTGNVSRVVEVGDGRRIAIAADGVFDGMDVGDSVSVSGVCLTAERVGDGSIECFLAEETVERSWFSELTEGDLVNLERPLRPTDAMGGHIVEGHVETVADVLQIEELEAGWNLQIEKPPGFGPYLVEKGFVAVDGMSLTVVGVDEDSFEVTIVPETWEISSVSEKRVGDPVNVETDPVARYVESVVAHYGVDAGADA